MEGSFSNCCETCVTSPIILEEARTYSFHELVEQTVTIKRFKVWGQFFPDTGEGGFVVILNEEPIAMKRKK